MRVNGITGYNFNNKTSFRGNNVFVFNRGYGKDSFTTTAPKTSFTGALKKEEPKKPLTAQEKKSKEINTEIVVLMLAADRIKEDAKKEKERMDLYLRCGFLVGGQTFVDNHNKIYELDRDYDGFTVTFSKYAKKEHDTKMRVYKSKPVMCIRKFLGEDGNIEEDTYRFTENGFKYSEKVKDKRGKKIYTKKKVDLIIKNGIGKTTYTERNEDGSFTTYEYQGSGKSIFGPKYDKYDSSKAVWKQRGKRTMNLAENVS